MAEYIDRQAALDVIDDLFQATVRGEITNARYVATLADGRIEDIPAADVRENKTGHWIKTEDGDLECSECGHLTDDWVDIFSPSKRDCVSGKRAPMLSWAMKHPYFCSKCGADMREVDTDD